MAKGNDELKEATELEKARGEMPSQKEIRAYHEGDFQTTDPVTGEKRDNTGGTWVEQDEIQDNALGEEEITPSELQSAQQAELEHSASSAAAEAAAPSARKSAVKKSARKSGR